MKPERSIKELLIILRDNLERCFDEYEADGMCIVIDNLANITEVIDSDEEFMLVKYLVDNRPQAKKYLRYWWDAGELAPRLEWLNQQIEKL